eukprot:c10824_g1_i2.p1 GENE.c10824_g1_i2~~c10824_g1_i2.p1  ORF type:complete len:524 (+),score=120.48 c10824_g1_i2:103-1572(+)
MAASGSYDYDLVVIGGGSGGLACSREAVKMGAKKVAVLDFVKPSPQNTSWGLGGTCVNVGCIPKKLYHTAGLMGESIHDAGAYGWQVTEGPHDWPKLVDAIQAHIGSLNWGYKVALKDEAVEYRNELGRLIDAHTIECTNRKKQVSRITADKIVIAVGGRPTYPDIPGAVEHCLTSDDIFSHDEPPGKTLVVGAAYVALECAGFLTGLGYDTTVMARSVLLRGFDQEMANHVGAHMTTHGTKFIREAVPTKVEKDEATGKLTVSYAQGGETRSEVFDTVLFAIGRSADTKKLGLAEVGVATNPANGKVIADAAEQTSVSNIYALGDVLDGKPELTPVAIKAGRMLAHRLFGGKTALMDYGTIPTVVFTPLEYGVVGLAEEDALAKYGADNVDVYHTYPSILEHSVPHRPENTVYAKMVVLRSEAERVVGIHYAGPNAGEIVQGFAVAMKMGATKAAFDAVVGIHPTVAEEFFDMHITKRSGKDPKKTGC